MAIDVKRGLEQKEFLLANDKDFHTQIHSIKRTSNGGKYFTFDADRNEKGHADSFWAWALANAAVGNETTMNFYDQRRQRRIEMQKETEKKNVIETPSTTITKNDDGTTETTIKRGKSLRQINKGFGFNESV